MIIAVSLVVFSEPACFIDLTGANPTSSVPVDTDDWNSTEMACCDAAEFRAVFEYLFPHGCNVNVFIRCRINPFTVMMSLENNQ